MPSSRSPSGYQVNELPESPSGWWSARPICKASERKLTSNGVNQELVGWHAILEKQADHASRTLPGDGEWLVKGNSAVVGIGDDDLCIGHGKGRAQNEDLHEQHLDNQSVWSVAVIVSYYDVRDVLVCLVG